MKDIRILYMGTPELSMNVLKGLIENGFNIVGLICQEDKPVGRKGLIEPVPTKKVALEYNIPVYQPHKIRLDYEFVKEIKPDLIVTCAYGQILPQGLLDIPRLGSINVHGSLLPKYRGASPIQQALINGDKEAGVTIIEMIDKMDAGEMILKESFIVDEDDNYSSMCDKMAAAGLKALIRAIPLITNHQEERIYQDDSQATYCAKISKEDEHLDLSKNSNSVVNWIKALSYTPGSYVLLDDQILKIYKAKVVDYPSGAIGEIVKADKNGLYISTGDGVISILELQKQGKKKMDFKSFINGEKNLLGKVVK